MFCGAVAKISANVIYCIMPYSESMSRAELRNLLLDNFDRVSGSKFVAALILANQELKASNAGKNLPPELLSDAEYYMERVVRTYYNVENDLIILDDCSVPLDKALKVFVEDVCTDPPEGSTPIEEYINKAGDIDRVKEYVDKAGIPVYANFFIRKVSTAGAKVLVEISPITEKQATKEQYVLEIDMDGSDKSAASYEKIKNHAGDIIMLNVTEKLDGTYKLDEVLTERPQEKAFKAKQLTFEESNERRTDDLPLLGYGVLANGPTQAWVETDSKDMDFVYRFDLQRKCDTLSQYNIAARQMQSVYNLQKPETFDMMSHKAKAWAVGRMEEGGGSELERFVLARKNINADEFANYVGKKESLQSNIPPEKLQQFEAARDDIKRLRAGYIDFCSRSQGPETLDDVLSGREMHLVEGEAVESRVMHNVERTFKENMPTSTEVGSDSFFSQLRNYSHQRALRDTLVASTTSGVNMMFETEKNLMAMAITPMVNPYRDQLQSKVLNKENSEMISMTVIGALMQRHKVVPKKGLEKLFSEQLDPDNPTKPLRKGRIDEMFDSLEYEPEEGETLDNTLDKLLHGTTHAQAKLTTSIIETVETECYPPGKSPQAKRAQQLNDLDTRMKGGMVGAGMAVSGAEKAVGALEELSIFR